MNILVTLDSNYINPLTVMLRSIVTTNRCTPIDLYVVHSGLTEYDLGRIASVADSISVHSIMVDDALFDGAHFTPRISKETYYRLLMGELLPQSVHRILYLDPDIVVTKPLDNLYDMDMRGMVMAAAGHTHGVVERFNRLRLGMPSGCRYINAGVLLVDVDRFRMLMSSERIFAYVDRMGARLFQADQDVLNALLCRHTLYLDEREYNLDEHTYRRSNMTMRDVARRTTIVHYDGKNKPWRDDYHGELGTLFRYYETKDVKNYAKPQIQSIIPA